LAKTVSKLHRLDENVGAADVELRKDDLREIESAVSKTTIQGARYPEQIERLSDRERVVDAGTNVNVACGARRFHGAHMVERRTAQDRGSGRPAHPTSAR